MPQVRQLAAIMFSDIVGYTAMMGEDEQKAFDLLKKNRQLQKPLIEKYGGQWIKEIGDGVLASFPTITDAVTCACQIQQDASFVPELQLRIGIHQGEVMFEDGDVFGDGVNIASRLQTLAPIGGIWVSESIYSNVANKKGIELLFIKEEYLKNVRQPIRIYEVLREGQAAPISIPVEPGRNGSPAPGHKVIPEKSIAVLPFVNMSNDPEQDYFSDGLSEEIINSLSHLNDLKVAGRSSSFQFKGTKVDLNEIKEKLGVRTVLEGSLRKYGNIVRLTVQLINVEDGFHIWSERYEKTLDNIFAIQDEIALAVTEKLKVSLLNNERQVATRVNTHNAQAYELFLKGRFHLNRRGIAIIKALELFEQAVALDPGFALAHAGIADACFLMGVYSLRSPTIVMPKGKEAAETAIRIDNALFEPYASLGFYYAVYTWDWEKSKQNFLKSLENNSTYIHCRCWYAFYYLTWVEGNFAEAETMCKEAIQLDPLNVFPFNILASVYYAKGDYEQAIEIANYAIELDMGSYLSYLVKGIALIASKKFDEAIECLELGANISKRFPMAMAMLVYAYSSGGQMDKATQTMEEMKIYLTKGIHISPYLMGMATSCLGDIDNAIQWLREAVNHHDPEVVTTMNYYIGPESFRKDPRYMEIVSKINFPH
jgi:TolB-like protein/class 3 adenylate cyclase